MAFQDPIVGGTILRIPALQSPNFSLAGKTGWAIMIDGSAYFFNVTATGIITATAFAGTDFNINSSGIFFYSAAPAAGDLAISLAYAAGTDTYGNVYPSGLNITAGGKAVVVGLTGGAPLIYFVSTAPDLTNGAALQDIILGAGLGQYDFLQILSAENTTNNDLVLQGFAGSSQDGTQLAEIIQQYKDSAGVYHTFYTMTKNGPAFPAGLAVTGTLTQTGQIAISRSSDSSAVAATYSAANSTNAAYSYTASATTGRLLGSSVAGDTFGRFVVDVNGSHSWGPGNAARDVTLERTAAGVLTCDNSFTVANTFTADGDTQITGPAFVTNNLTVGQATALGDNGVGVLELANATTVPTTNPTGGGVLYEKQGVPTHRDPGGHTLGMVRSYAARATSQLSSFTAEADVPGATVSVVVTGSNATILATASWDCNAGGAPATMVGFFNWNGADQSAQGIHVAPTTGGRNTVHQNYQITGIAAGTYTAKLRASCTVSNNLNQVGGAHTGFTVLLIDQ